LAWRTEGKKGQTGSDACNRRVDARQSVSLSAAIIVDGAEGSLHWPIDGLIDGPIDWPVVRVWGRLEKQERTPELREGRRHQRNPQPSAVSHAARLSRPRKIRESSFPRENRGQPCPSLSAHRRRRRVGSCHGRMPRDLRPHPPPPSGFALALAGARLPLLIEMRASPAVFMGMCTRWRRR